MFFLQVSMHAQTHQVFFENEVDANTELAKLLPKLGQERWGKNREESPTHTISSPIGDVVVVLEKVEMARVINADLDHEVGEKIRAKRDDVETRSAVQRGLAMKAAGLKAD